MKIALTDNAMIGTLQLPPGATEEKFWDYGKHDDCVIGFGLRLRASGTRTWIFQYKFGSKHARLKIGTWPSLSLEKARAKARKYRHEVDDGGHPAAARVEAKKRSAETFKVIAERFLDRQAKRLKPRSLVEVERHLRKRSKSLHDKLLTNIDRRAIAGLLSEIAAEHGPFAGNRTRASLSSFFAWAMKQGLLEANPVIGTDRPAEEVERDRVLTDSEMREIWQALLADDYGDIVKLLALTGQRRDEIASLRWSEVDFDSATITLPPPRTKNRRDHIVPISAPVIDILKTRKRLVDRDLVFGSGRGGYQGWSTSKEALDARLLEVCKKHDRKAQPLPYWTLHDLRRTMSTIMADGLDVPPHVIEAVINHISGHKGGVHGVYNRAQYERQKRLALNKWASYLMTIVADEPEKVVSIRVAS